MANAPHRFRNGRGENALLDGFLALADEWIARTGGAGGTQWFRGAINDVVHASNDRALGVAIGLAPRRLGKADLALTNDDKKRAAALRPGFDPSDWSVDQVARVAFMIASHDGSDAAFAARFDSFCRPSSTTLQAPQWLPCWTRPTNHYRTLNTNDSTRF